MRNTNKAVFCSALLSLAACGGDGADFGTAAQGDINLSITDAPIDMAEAVTITFDQVTIKPIDGSPKQLQDLESTTLNLLDYTGGASELLINTADDADDNPVLPSGDYEWMRFHIATASITINGSEYELEIPSGDTSGLKLNTPFTIPADGVAYYTIDFDLRHSVLGPFTKDGVLGEVFYKLKPVLRLVENEAVGVVTGSVDSTLLASCVSDTAVYVFEGSDVDALDDIDSEAPEASLTDADAIEPFMSVSVSPDAGDASFTFGFVPAGKYTIAFACGEDSADVNDELVFQSVTNIDVLAGESTEVEL
ncbi:MAG: DUF4382 domain-containing protein [Gammaproteobacteria bacterium]|nr:DUF4382 domain-containing protein [Gammaproteobacteria bacterium]